MSKWLCDSRRAVRTPSEHYLLRFVEKLNQTNWIRAVHTHWPTRIGSQMKIGMFFARISIPVMMSMIYVRLNTYLFFHVFYFDRSRQYFHIEIVWTVPKKIFKFDCDRFHNENSTHQIKLSSFWSLKKTTTTFGDPTVNVKPYTEYTRSSKMKCIFISQHALMSNSKDCDEEPSDERVCNKRR